MKNKINADDWISKLKLSKHPEGGYYREIYRSEEVFSGNALPERFSGDRNFSTSIYYLLKSGEFSSFHKIKSDEIWHFYDGSSVVLHVINNEGSYKRILLGRNIFEDECLQFVISYGNWFAAEVKDGNSFSLVGCTVAPGFDFADFEMGRKEILKQMFPHHADLIERLSR